MLISTSQMRNASYFSQEKYDTFLRQRPIVRRLHVLLLRGGGRRAVAHGSVYSIEEINFLSQHELRHSRIPRNADLSMRLNFFRKLLLVAIIPSISICQLLPELPTLPSPPPSPSKSPVPPPSRTSTPVPSPSRTRTPSPSLPDPSQAPPPPEEPLPTQLAVLPSVSQVAEVSPSNAIGLSPSQVLAASPDAEGDVDDGNDNAVASASGSPTAPTASQTPVILETLEAQPTSSPTAVLPSAPNIPNATLAANDDVASEDDRCVRDISKPRPKLGKSQQRYAVSVLLSAAAAGIASILYNGVYTWKPKQKHPGWRFIGIVIARLLVIGAVRISAALVASITKASPDDGALDASGAFLTWGYAIFLRLYHEGICMTLTALGFGSNETVWDDKVRDFLNRPLSFKGDKSERTHENQRIVQNFDDIEEYEDEPGSKISSSESASIVHYLLTGRWERKLLLIVATIYFAAELAALISNLLDLLGSLDTSNNESIFVADSTDGQCPINSDDVKGLVGTIFLQGVYTLTYQPSLVPLLTISSFPSGSRANVNDVLTILRWGAYFVLALWVTSLLTLPLLEGMLEPIFITGDISLFWFVMLAPPSYSSTSYIIMAIYTCLAAMAGVILIYRISHCRKRERRLEMSP